MITHRFRFVKNFFQVFSNFFVLSFAAQLELSPPASQPTRLSYHTQFRLSTPFFKFFELFSGAGLAILCGWRFRPVDFRPAAERLLILANHPHFVNTFFHFFRLFSPHLFPQLYLLPFSHFLPQYLYVRRFFSFYPYI